MVVANSKDIARFFGKRHDNVLRDIENISSNLRGSSKGWFLPTVYLDSYKRTQDAYDMTRDGFALLVMGYTGAKAMEFKVRYIQEFNRMADQPAATVTHRSP